MVQASSYFLGAPANLNSMELFQEWLFAVSAELTVFCKEFFLFLQNEWANAYREILPSFLVDVEWLQADPVIVRDETWKENSGGLYVLIPGLRSKPVCFAEYLESIKEADPTADVRIVDVPHEGNCSLEEAVAPVQRLVEEYKAQNPGKPICLIGGSNGGRIAAEVELRFRLEQTKMKVVGIAGAFFGTRRLDMVQDLPISHFLYHPSVIEELHFGSDMAKRILDRQREEVPEGSVRDFEFHATRNDLVISPWQASLPILGHGEKHFIHTRCSHTSILRAVREQVVDSCTQWMREHRSI